LDNSKNSNFNKKNNIIENLDLKNEKKSQNLNISLEFNNPSNSKLKSWLKWQNNSCAYDVMLSLIYFVFEEKVAKIFDNFQSCNECKIFQNILLKLNSEDFSARDLLIDFAIDNIFKDKSMIYNFVPIYSIIYYLFNNNEFSHSFKMKRECSMCGNFEEFFEKYLIFELVSSNSVQNYFEDLINQKKFYCKNNCSDIIVKENENNKKENLELKNKIKKIYIEESRVLQEKGPSSFLIVQDFELSDFFIISLENRIKPTQSINIFENFVVDEKINIGSKYTYELVSIINFIQKKNHYNLIFRDLFNKISSKLKGEYYYFHDGKKNDGFISTFCIKHFLNFSLNKNETYILIYKITNQR